eukprot:Em0002g1431a
MSLAVNEFTITADLPNYVPASVGQRIEGLLALSIVQVDTILSLISLPENAQIEWWKNYNYIEDLNDERGYTVTLFGATSGTGDLAVILDFLRARKETHKLLGFYDALKMKRGPNVDGIQGMVRTIQTLGNDKDWQGAVWDEYVNEYWVFVTRFCNLTLTRPGPVLNTPLVKGFILDAAINHGPDIEAYQVIFDEMLNKNNPDEKEWFKDFAETRRLILARGYEHLDTSNTGDRSTLWANMANENNWNLTRPIQPFEGYWAQ